MRDAAAFRQIKSRYRALAPLMDERMRRQWAATEAQTYGRGGVSAVASATGMSRNTIRKGLLELAARKKNPRASVPTRIRKEGGGRERLTETDPGLAQALDRLIEPTTRGDPMSPLRWTCKSTMNLAQALTRHGHAVGAWTVGAMLKQAGYSLQSNRKTKEGASHPDRNAQFEYINGSVERFQQRGQPVISVDTKKKELVGPFKNGGREWQPKGEPEEVVVAEDGGQTLSKGPRTVDPVIIAQLIRRALIRRGQAAFDLAMAKIGPWSITVLLATLVLLFAFQGEAIIDQPLVIALLAVPILIQVLFNSTLAYWLNRKLGEKHAIACPSALIGASNFFELAVAAAISLFGFESGAALATVVGVLIEVPVMLLVVRVVNATRGWYETGDGKVSRALR